MKKDIHPPYHTLCIDIKGKKIETGSTMSGTVYIEQAYWDHPAWTKKAFTAADESNKAVSSFNKRFAGLNIFNKPNL